MINTSDFNIIAQVLHFSYSDLRGLHTDQTVHIGENAAILMCCMKITHTGNKFE